MKKKKTDTEETTSSSIHDLLLHVMKAIITEQQCDLYMDG